MLLGEDGKRRLRLRQMTNQELFVSYDSDLVLRNQSSKGLYEARRVLKHFRDFLGKHPPTPELGRRFLGQFGACRATTLYRYAQIVNGFFAWYGEKLDVRIRVPHKLPQYIEDKDISALLQAIQGKSTHKKSVQRDLLLVELALNTGLRRAELANLEVKDIRLDQGMLTVRGGKGGKDAVIPLNAKIKARLRTYISTDMEPERKLFGLKPSSISGKIERFAKKAKVDVHCHSLRHYFGTKLMERGANPEAVRQLMRHERLDTTQRYISLASKGLQDAVELLSCPAGRAVAEPGESQGLGLSEVEVEVSIEPGKGAYLPVALPASDVWIESIDVRPSDDGCDFQFSLFDREPELYPGKQDVLFERESTGHRIIYSPERLKLYHDRDRSNQLHCVIGVTWRHYRFDIDGQELQTYLEKPVSFTLTLLYRVAR